MGQLRRTGFVEHDTIRVIPCPQHVVLHGEVACLGEIVVAVSKWPEVLQGDGGDDATVQTIRYAYNASVRGYHSFLRYDNMHVHRGHRDRHHRHEFDWRAGRLVPGGLTWVGEAGWPTLGQFIMEVEQWYWQHRHELPNPDKLPVLGLWRAPVDLPDEPIDDT